MVGNITTNKQKQQEQRSGWNRKQNVSGNVNNKTKPKYKAPKNIKILSAILAFNEAARVNDRHSSNKKCLIMCKCFSICS